MVLVALYEGNGTVNMGVSPVGVFAHHLIGIAIAMTLLVGLVHDVDAITVAQFI